MKAVASVIQVIARITIRILLLPIQSRPSTLPSTIQLPIFPQLQLQPQLLPLTLTVSDFGALGDGIHYDTAAIQSAIDACPSTSASPCHVVFPSGGTYLTATIRLKSHVTLNIQENATLLGGTRIEDYPWESSRWYVVLAENATDVGITGGGVVDGQGMKFVVSENARKNVMVSWNKTGACLGDECRPRLVGFLGCNNVNIWKIRLNEPAYWWCVSFIILFCWMILLLLLHTCTAEFHPPFLLKLHCLLLNPFQQNLSKPF